MTFEELCRLLPGCSAADVRSIVNEEIDTLVEDGMSWTDATDESYRRVLMWFTNTGDDAERIRRTGLAEFVNSHRSPKVRMTLLALKARGITELPL